MPADFKCAPLTTPALVPLSAIKPVCQWKSFQAKLAAVPLEKETCQKLAQNEGSYFTHLTLLEFLSFGKVPQANLTLVRSSKG